MYTGCTQCTRVLFNRGRCRTITTRKYSRFIRSLPSEYECTVFDLPEQVLTECLLFDILSEARNPFVLLRRRALFFFFPPDFLYSSPLPLLYPPVNGFSTRNLAPADDHSDAAFPRCQMLWDRCPVRDSGLQKENYFYRQMYNRVIVYIKIYN